MAIRQITGDDWQLYREIRLAALVADPGAFGSTHAREIAFVEDDWRRRITVGPDGRASATFVHDGVEAGTADGTVAMMYLERQAAPMLIAMWVRPTARGTGLGRDLVEAACDWAREQGESQVKLWVVQDNAPAIGLYESLGFRPTGIVDTLPSNPCSGELEMVREL